MKPFYNSFVIVVLLIKLRISIFGLSTLNFTAHQLYHTSRIFAAPGLKIAYIPYRLVDRINEKWYKCPNKWNFAIVNLQEKYTEIWRSRENTSIAEFS